MILVAATIIAFSPAIAATNNATYGVVPTISLESVDMGNHAFASMESYHIGTGKSLIHRTSSVLNVSSLSNMVSPISDTLSLNDSVHLTTHSISENFPLPNGTYRFRSPPEQSYLNSIAVQGNSSFGYITLVEKIMPAMVVGVGGSPISGTLLLQNSSVYNVTIGSGNSSYVLHSPGLVYVGKSLVQVELSVTSNGGISSFLSFSFPVSDGNFSFKFDQVMSSGTGQQITENYLSAYKLPGFSSPFIQNLVSNTSSLAAGGAIFVILMLGVYVYYRKK